MQATSWETYFRIGMLLVVPFTEHMVLTATMLLVGVGIVIPPLFLWKTAISLYSTLNFGHVVVGSLLAYQGISRSYSRLNVTGWKRYFLAFIGSDVLIALVSIVSAILAGAYVVLYILALTGCSDHTELDLCEWVYNTTTACTAANVNALWRRPNFARDLLWFQLCLDDFAISVTWTALAAAGVVLDIVVVFFVMSHRERTFRFYRAVQSQK